MGWVALRMATGSYSGMPSDKDVAAVASVARMRMKGWLRIMSRPSTLARIEASMISRSERVAETGRTREDLADMSVTAWVSTLGRAICSAS